MSTIGSPQDDGVALKMFTVFECNTVCRAFGSAVVRKPATGKSGNSEVYAVCAGARPFQNDATGMRDVTEQRNRETEAVPRVRGQVWSAFFLPRTRRRTSGFSLEILQRVSDPLSRARGKEILAAAGRMCTFATTGTATRSCSVRLREARRLVGRPSKSSVSRLSVNVPFEQKAYVDIVSLNDLRE